MVSRDEIDQLLSEAAACPGDSWNLWAPELIELCRAWLALDSAERVTATEDHDGGPAVIYPRTIETNESAWLIPAAKP